eukprot:6038989-Pyramimonas_sp.AAC.1
MVIQCGAGVATREAIENTWHESRYTVSYTLIYTTRGAGVATREAIENTVGFKYDVCNKRLVEELGVALRPLKETVTEMVAAM